MAHYKKAKLEPPVSGALNSLATVIEAAGYTGMQAHISFYDGESRRCAIWHKGEWRELLEGDDGE